jgi:hypothetical protein
MRKLLELLPFMFIAATYGYFLWVLVLTMVPYWGYWASLSLFYWGLVISLVMGIIGSVLNLVLEDTERAIRVLSLLLVASPAIVLFLGIVASWLGFRF